ncbi:MAG: hypothetical protein QGG36_10540 [Pirellulaceae bacterium]|jgi:hypothetical protein|nr:hypothetical protein [Pirellulaceae bacterium]
MRSARGFAGDGAPMGGWARTLRQMGVCARRDSPRRGHNGGGRLDDGPGSSPLLTKLATAETTDATNSLTLARMEPAVICHSSLVVSSASIA